MGHSFPSSLLFRQRLPPVYGKLSFLLFPAQNNDFPPPLKFFTFRLSKSPSHGLRLFRCLPNGLTPMATLPRHDLRILFLPPPTSNFFSSPPLPPSVRCRFCNQLNDTLERVLFNLSSRVIGLSSLFSNSHINSLSPPINAYKFSIHFLCDIPINLRLNHQ